MSVTIKDIAKLSGVSTATVSKIINGKDNDIGKATIERVKRIIEEQNYSPNTVARSMITKKTKTIGLVIPDVRNPFFTDLARGAEDVANERGYGLLFCNTDDDLKKEIRYINNLIEKQVDGIALAGVAVRDQALEEKIDIKVPIVSLDRNVYFKGIKGKIEVDNYSGAYDAVTHLIKLGHKNIMFLSGQLNIKLTRDRLEGYKRALADNNLEYNEKLTVFGTYSSEFGYESMKNMTLDKAVTAIFCGNDLIAIGAMNALKGKNLRIPEDISIVGFDDIYIASLVTPALTTVRQPSYEIGYQAVETLIDIIECKKESSHKVEIKLELKVRESTCKRRSE
ncbi:MAG TPA: LacI family DNA-binding transcriptional regulator [Clostridia bacterium]|nr:LacI family DNA-binding transcriptional regulator [Clostridia bacterium]